MKTVLDFALAKKEGRRISIITCYDSTSAKIAAASNVDCLLVGDSVAMTMHGFTDTVNATPEMMVLHVASVRRGAPEKFVVADLPFLAHRGSLDATLACVAKVMRAGANAVKIEDPIRDSEAVLKKLDLDLGLGLGLDREGGADQAALYGQSEDLKAFGAELEKQLQSASPRDRMDIGIGFLEMGLMDLAIHQFKSAQRASELRSAATGLWAYSLILSGRPFDASQILEPMLSDTELGAEEKIDLFYLMARAQERLGRVGYAADWYNQVLELDPAYRDVRDRLRSLPRPAPSGQDA